MRGEHPPPDRGLLRAEGIIPACAGSTSNLPPHLVTYGDHPRMRGEHGAVPSLRMTP